MSQLLAGLRVLDFTRVLAGPHCTKVLQDLGASVDKIEPPSSDLGRMAYPVSGDTSHFYAQQNAGKRNVSIDLNYAEGREIALRLAQRADIIVENFRPGTLDFYGLDYQAVAKINPGVIYASISGYGQDGPWRNRAGFAPTVQAEVGFTRSLLDYYGLDESQARHDMYAHADTYAGLQAVIAILAALHQRDATGEGQHIDIAMAATMLYVNERFNHQATDIDTNGEPIILGAAESPVITLPSGVAVTIAGSPVFTPIFRRYCAMMHRTDLLADPRFLTPALRKQHQSALFGIVRQWMLTFDSFEDLEAQVRVSGMALGTLRTTREFLASEWAQHRKPLIEISDGAGGTIAVPRPAWLFSKAKIELPTTVARRGEHNAAVLRELDIADVDIRRLQDAGVLRMDSGAAPVMPDATAGAAAADVSPVHRASPQRRSDAQNEEAQPRQAMQ